MDNDMSSEGLIQSSSGKTFKKTVFHTRLAQVQSHILCALSALTLMTLKINIIQSLVCANGSNNRSRARKKTWRRKTENPVGCSSFCRLMSSTSSMCKTSEIDECYVQQLVTGIWVLFSAHCHCSLHSKDPKKKLLHRIRTSPILHTQCVRPPSTWGLIFQGGRIVKRIRTGAQKRRGEGKVYF